MRRQNHEDVSMAPGGREQVRLQCPLEGAVMSVYVYALHYICMFSARPIQQPGPDSELDSIVYRQPMQIQQCRTHMVA